MNSEPSENMTPVTKNLICFFDTETTGFVKKGPRMQPGQARCVQLAALFITVEGKEELFMDDIIRPEGFIIPSQVAAIHGITTERALAEGKDRLEVLAKFQEKLARSQLVVAHNFDYDTQIMEIEQEYSAGKFDWTMRPASFCTMKQTTNICKIPSARGGYKWPKLVEAYRHFFGKDFADAHNAKADMMAMFEIYQELKKLGVTPALA